MTANSAAIAVPNMSDRSGWYRRNQNLMGPPDGPGRILRNLRYEGVNGLNERFDDDCRARCRYIGVA
jgi:hypothetical protein